MRLPLWPAAGLLAGVVFLAVTHPALPATGVSAATPQAGPPAAGPESAKPADPSMAEDVQDVLFFAESRPVLIRLHIRVDGKPYGARWDEYLTRWFKFLDRDEDGFLDREEAARAPAPQMLQQLQGNPFFFYNNVAPPFDDLDRDRDKKVSPTEFLRYYRGSPAGPVQVVPLFNVFNPNGPRQDALTDVLFGALDADKDGKLSRRELEMAEIALLRYDQDDDELITAQELLGTAAGTQFAPRPPQPGQAAPPSPLMLVPKEDAPRRLTQRLRVAREVLAHYDRNKNQQLSRDEIRMPAEQFDQLDANKDGELDAFELLRWVIVTPDAEVVLRMGKMDGKTDLVDILPCVATKDKKKPALRKVSAGALAFMTDDTCINLVQAPTVLNPTVQRTRQMLEEQFRAADLQNKGFLTEKQVQGGQFVFLRSVLAVADRDEDGKLTMKEFNAWLDLVGSGLGCQVTVTLAESGRGLFQILDTNQDGRLSIRELRNAWSRLAPYDWDGDRCVTRKEVPYQYQVVVNPGGANYFAAQPGQPGGRQPGVLPPGPAPNPRAPLWFRKMDRNGDGDVSPREFLGTRADFRKLDTDGDGLISLEEALAADAALRKK